MRKKARKVGLECYAEVQLLVVLLDGELFRSNAKSVLCKKRVNQFTV